MSENLSRRETWVTGVQTLLAFLKDDLTIVRAIRKREYLKVYSAAHIAQKGIPRSLAMTDPALFRSLQNAVTLFYLKGYNCINVAKAFKMAEQQKRIRH